MKKLLILIALLLCFSLLLASCSGGDNGNGSGDGESEDENGGNEAPDYSDYLFSKSTGTTIIVNDSNISKKTTDIYNAIKTNTGRAPELFYSDKRENIGHEIVIGESERTVSKKAYRGDTGDQSHRSG